MTRAQLQLKQDTGILKIELEVLESPKELLLHFSQDIYNYSEYRMKLSDAEKFAKVILQMVSGESEK